MSFFNYEIILIVLYVSCFVLIDVTCQDEKDEFNEEVIDVKSSDERASAYKALYLKVKQERDEYKANVELLTSVDVADSPPQERYKLLEEINYIRQNFNRLPPLGIEYRQKCSIYWVDYHSRNDSGVAFDGCHMMLMLQFLVSSHPKYKDHVLIYAFPFSTASDYLIPSTKIMEFQPRYKFMKSNFTLLKKTMLYKQHLQFDSRHVLKNYGKIGELDPANCKYASNLI